MILLATLTLLVLATSSLVLLAAFPLLPLRLLTFFRGLGAHAMLRLIGVFVCHDVLLYVNDSPNLFRGIAVTQSRRV